MDYFMFPAAVYAKRLFSKMNNFLKLLVIILIAVLFAFMATGGIYQIYNEEAIVKTYRCYCQSEIKDITDDDSCTCEKIPHN